ncbi:MAG: 3-deoxy-7-phosphoheptulonate synthase [Gemmatimonadota bacterium]
MIVVLREDASRRDIDHVVRRAASLRLKAHVTQEAGRTRIGLHGDMEGLEAEVFGGLPGVEEVREVTRPFHLASREFQPESSEIVVDGIAVGADELVLMAGPCSVETESRMMRIGEAVLEAGATFLRGGAFKPRSSPYSFRGLAEEGLEILARVREATGLRVVTEVMSPELVGLVADYADLMQVGARNMQNYALLDALGEAGVPVLLKRGMSSTIEEFLLSAEYILAKGNPHVILCERGIRTFEPMTRNSLDITSVPLLKELTHLPVVVDPSHATGRASLVPAAGRAAVAAGCDGLIVEVHYEPESAWSDGAQTIATDAFRNLAVDVARLAGAVGRSFAGPEAGGPPA